MKTREIDVTKNREVKIPSSWKGKVRIFSFKDAILIKRVEESALTLSEILEETKQLRDKISEKDIQEAIAHARARI